MLKQEYSDKSFAKPKPFLKWAGGKRQSLDKFDNIFPKNFNVFHEPMIGGGAVFFHLILNYENG
jgi:DNA adenine methylase